MSVDGQTVEGKTITGLIDKLSEKETPGFTIDIRTKKSPKDGFIASDVGAERVLDFAPLKASRAALRTALKDYINDHAELLDNKGSFFGAWVEEGKLYLDVSRRYSSRSEGVRAGFKNDQKAIYDVVNDSYIYMKDEVDDRANKASISGNSQASQGNDGAREGRLRGRNLGSDRGQSLNRHVCLGRYTIQKHRQGEHDQATHGNWAGDRYPTDSVKGARDGAKEYAFKKGLKPDEVKGGTFSVTNPGMFGCLVSTPIINQPQVAILSVGAIVRRPVVLDNDEIVVRPIASVGITFDHRVIDGEGGARFLANIFQQTRWQHSMQTSQKKLPI
jgi:hypothetical protein